ncbi:hypothetical protein K438DRAFT_1748497 [Mycena galopus ATCC 62051]|nr:hypothetical protein K438DRAFT_1748497 [Mycena galopus ATCC 62051]
MTLLSDSLHITHKPCFRVLCAGNLLVVQLVLSKLILGDWRRLQARGEAAMWQQEMHRALRLRVRARCWTVFGEYDLVQVVPVEWTLRACEIPRRNGGGAAVQSTDSCANAVSELAGSVLRDGCMPAGVETRFMDYVRSSRREADDCRRTSWYNDPCLMKDERGSAGRRNTTSIHWSEPGFRVQLFRRSSKTSAFNAYVPTDLRVGARCRASTRSLKAGSALCYDIARCTLLMGRSTNIPMCWLCMTQAGQAAMGRARRSGRRERVDRDGDGGSSRPGGIWMPIEWAPLAADMTPQIDFLVLIWDLKSPPAFPAARSLGRRLRELSAEGIETHGSPRVSACGLFCTLIDAVPTVVLAFAGCDEKRKEDLAAQGPESERLHYCGKPLFGIPLHLTAKVLKLG